ncbi:alpha-tocopherol transfer protein-like [Brevipalpus obovatus]|uniref:alpha-tocopherol transfer protein-like n=1 Tax=Brevipalpus obovatus TaxID=246614 RepID=UPI003D9F51C5
MKTIESVAQPSQELVKFRSLLKEDEMLQKFTFNEEYLAFFLRLMKYDHKKAMEYLVQHISVIRSVPNAFQWSDKMRKVLECDLHVVSKSRCLDGSGLIFFRPKQWKPRELNMIDVIRTSLVAIYSEILSDEMIQEKGFHSIIDSSGTTFSHVFAIRLSDIKCFSTIGNHSSPNMIKRNIHIYTHRVIEFGHSLMKPFLSSESYESFTFYGKDLTEFYQRYPKTCLPPDFGGTFTDEYTVDERLAKFEKYRNILEPFWNRIAVEE